MNSVITFAGGSDFLVGTEVEITKQLGNLVGKKGLKIIVFHANTRTMCVPGLLEAIATAKRERELSNGKIILLGVKIAAVSEPEAIEDVEGCRVFKVLSKPDFHGHRADFSNPVNQPIFEEIRREIGSIRPSAEVPFRDADLEAIQRVILAAKGNGLSRAALLAQITGILTNN